jgi:hypothetical protein
MSATVGDLVKPDGCRPGLPAPLVCGLSFAASSRLASSAWAGEAANGSPADTGPMGQSRTNPLA